MYSLYNEYLTESEKVVAKHLLIKNYENIISETRMLIKRQTVPINESERTEDMILKSLITRIENPREIVNVESSEVRDSLH